MKTTYFRVKGGITNGDKEKRKKDSKIDSIIIAEKYPDYCSLRERKNGYFDLKLKRGKCIGN